MRPLGAHIDSTVWERKNHDEGDWSMIDTSRWLALAVGGLCACLLVVGTATAETWTDASGSFRIEAEFVGVQDKNVLLRKPDGKTVSVPIERLSGESRELARRLYELQRSAAPATAGSRAASSTATVTAAPPAAGLIVLTASTPAAPLKFTPPTPTPTPPPVAPLAAAGRRNPVIVESLGDLEFRVALLDEIVEDPPNHRDLFRWPLGQRHPLVLDAFVLTGVQDVQRLAFLIEQQSRQAVRRFTAGQVTLFGDLDAATPHLVAQLTTVLRRAKAFELNIDRIERIVFLGLADRRVDDLLFMLLADR